MSERERRYRLRPGKGLVLAAGELLAARFVCGEVRCYDLDRGVLRAILKAESARALLGLRISPLPALVIERVLDDGTGEARVMEVS